MHAGIKQFQICYIFGDKMNIRACKNKRIILAQQHLIQS